MHSPVLASYHLIQWEVPERFVEDVRKGDADEIVDQGLDEREARLPHRVDEEVGN